MPAEDHSCCNEQTLLVELQSALFHVSCSVETYNFFLVYFLKTNNLLLIKFVLSQFTFFRCDVLSLILAEFFLII